MRLVHLVGVLGALGCGGSDIGVKAPGFAFCDGLLNEEESRVDGPFDLDGDGFFDADNAGCVEAYSALLLDCDDTDEDVGGPTDWYPDADGDGHGVLGDVLSQCERPDGHAATGDDCDDATAAVSPSAEEICDGLDNDCNDVVDDDLLVWVFADADADGFGDPDVAQESCDPEPGWVEDGTDCDDASAAAFPGAEEVCDGADNDCDGAIDEGLLIWIFADEDDDAHGNPDAGMEACETAPGWVEDSTDCDDTTAAVHADAEEVCDDLDNDCDAAVDEGLIGWWYADADLDGWGDVSTGVESCAPGAGMVDNGEDCDDSTAARAPDAIEICDGIDNDCDDAIDEALLIDVYTDSDADGYGAPGTAREACLVGFGEADNGDDCDDSTASVSPAALEICDGLDNDCDDAVDEGLTIWVYADEDGDGYGDPATGSEGCDVGPGEADNGEDCDDTTATIAPDADEVCDGLDNDCDDAVDEFALDADDWYLDEDADGWGDDWSLSVACDAPSEDHIARGGDCDDEEEDDHPGAEEICDDGRDNDCDGEVDETCEGPDRSGIYDLEDDVFYECAALFGPPTVSLDFDTIQVIDSDPTITFISVGSSLPGTMIGTVDSDGAFLATFVFSGGCTETYTLAGEFTGPDSFEATLTAAYTGGFWCLDCAYHSWFVEGIR